MKIGKKLLVVLQVVILLLSTVTIASAETKIHQIPASDEASFLAVDYFETIGGVSVDADNRLIIEKEETDVSDLVTYKLNIEKSGYHKVLLFGKYETSKPTITMYVDGEEVNRETNEDLYGLGLSKINKTENGITVVRDLKCTIGRFYLPSGTHTLTFKFENGDANIKSVYIKNIEREIESGATILEAHDYYKAAISQASYEDLQFDYPTNNSTHSMSGPVHIPVSESTNLGSGSGRQYTYKLNVAENGQYRIRAYAAGHLNSEFYVLKDEEVLAVASGLIGESGVKNVTSVASSVFNLSAGMQEIVMRVHAVDDSPNNAGDNSLWLYYYEIEKVDSYQDTFDITDDNKNTLEAEDVFYSDEGVTINAESVAISENAAAAFYMNVESAGDYAFSMKYKTADGTKVKINNLTTSVYDGALIPEADGFLTHTIAVTALTSGENRITVKPTQELEIDSIYIKKLSNEASLTSINNASTEAEIETAIAAAETDLDIELTDAINGIFYKRPVYSRLIKVDYASIKDFINEYNNALVSEYNQPWITLYVDDIKKAELSSGNITLTASTGYVPKGSTMIAALYQNIGNNIKTLYNFAICEEVSQNTYDFLFGQTEINPENSYTLEFFYWDGLEKISPIDVFDGVYEEICVSTKGNDTTGDGSEEKPYATIKAALEKVAKINDYQWGDIIVNVKGGTYTLAETLVVDENYNGKNGYNVIIRGEKDNQPIVSGGIKVIDWTPHQGNIWKAPLSGLEYARNLYVNGYPAIMARSDRHYDTAVPNNTSENDGFVMSLDELGTDFKNPIGMEFVWPHTFETHITPVTGYQKSDGNITFLMNSKLLAQRSGVFRQGGSFYIQNAYELINEPGEFYYDAAEGFIYYYPYSYETMNTAETYVGNVEGMVKVAGSSIDSKVENITFENLIFRYGANNFINKYGYIGSQTDGVLVPFDWSEGNIAYKAQFAIDNADNINIEGCEFSCLGSAAISMIDSVSDSSINGNIIRDISGTGIRIGHPNHNRMQAGIEVCRNIDITNNVIRRIAGEMFNNCAITIYYEKFINILHNDIENVPYTAVSIGWGWGGGAAYDHSNIDVSNNKIQSVMNTLWDGGALYTLGKLKNSRLSGNYLKGLASKIGQLIGNDSGSAFLEIYNNVVLDGVPYAITTSNSATSNLRYYDNYSDIRGKEKVLQEQNIYVEEFNIVEGAGETLTGPAREIYDNAGLTDAYKSLLSKTGVELPDSGRAISSKLPPEPITEETKIYASEYDKATSSSDLEQIWLASGVGVSVTQEQYINYKISIPESGYYRIAMYGHADGDVSVNEITVGGDAKDVIMQIDNLQKYIARNTDRKYRVCTAYFEQGERNLTISVKNPESIVVIKELYYNKLEHTIEPEGENMIKIYNYYDSKGLYSNTYENSITTYGQTASKYKVTGCVCAAKETSLVYKLNVKEAGTYKAKISSWIYKEPCEYEILIGDEVRATATSGRSDRNDLAEFTDLQLNAGEVELTLKCKPDASQDGIFMFYLTFEKIS